MLRSLSRLAKRVDKAQNFYGNVNAVTNGTIVKRVAANKAKKSLLRTAFKLLK